MATRDSPLVTTKRATRSRSRRCRAGPTPSPHCPPRSMPSWPRLSSAAPVPRSTAPCPRMAPRSHQLTVMSGQLTTLLSVDSKNILNFFDEKILYINSTTHTGRIFVTLPDKYRPQPADHICPKIVLSMMPVFGVACHNLSFTAELYLCNI